MKEKAKVFLKRIIDIIRKPEMSILPGQLAFFFILSVVPIFSLVGILSGLFESSFNLMTDFLERSFPADISKVIVGVISGKSWDFSLVVFLIMSFVIASNGAYSIIISSNQLYKVNDSTFIKRRIKAIFLTFIIVLLFLFMLLIPVFGNHILELMHNVKILDRAENTITVLFEVIKWPLTILMVYVNIKLIYTFAPDANIKSKDTSSGAFFTSVLWIVATFIYSFYINTFASYDLFYGSLSNIIILMLWLYILAYIFVLGMALNATRQNLEEK